MNWDITVVGSANVDYIVMGERLPAAGETLMGEQFFEKPGGKGMNSAVAAARLGARTAFVGRIGEDGGGSLLVNRLTQEGIDTTFLVRDPQTPSGVAAIMGDREGRKQIFVALGANQKLSVSDVQAAKKAITGSKAILMQLEIPLECVLEAARIAFEAGVKVVLDPAPSMPLPDDLYPMLALMRMNNHEARDLTGVAVDDRQSAQKAAEIFLSRGVKAVVIQAGEEGNLAVWEGGSTLVPRVPVKCVDQTGAGDAFAAAMTLMLAEGTDWEQAVKFANATAALSTTLPGAQEALPTREAVNALLK